MQTGDSITECISIQGFPQDCDLSPVFFLLLMKKKKRKNLLNVEAFGICIETIKKPELICRKKTDYILCNIILSPTKVTYLTLPILPAFLQHYLCSVRNVMFLQVTPVMCSKLFSSSSAFLPFQPVGRQQAMF